MEVKNRHNPYEDEKDNVCNMDELGTIEIYKSEQTGKIYANFILLDGSDDSGLWFDTKEIFPDEFEEIKNKLLSIIANRGEE